MVHPAQLFSFHLDKNVNESGLYCSKNCRSTEITSSPLLLRSTLPIYMCEAVFEYFNTLRALDTRVPVVSAAPLARRKCFCVLRRSSFEIDLFRGPIGGLLLASGDTGRF